MTDTILRHDWRLDEIEALFDLPFNDLLFQAQTLHRAYFDPNQVQMSSLLSIKTGACAEDCGYCSQSAKHATGLEAEKLMPVEDVVAAAEAAKEKGASRFCMGAAWRNPTDKNLERVIEMVEAVHGLGMETCLTLGMLTQDQAGRLRSAGLDYYNHNLDTSPEFYGNVITTRTFDDRLQTLAHVRDAGINVCSGGILGMGESRRDRASMLRELCTLPRHPESVPINLLVKIEGTPLYDTEDLDPLEFVRTIAVARLLMPGSYVRLSAGRGEMSDEMQALCFLAGANSIFYGERLLTTENPEADRDRQLLRRLGMKTEQLLETEVKAAKVPCDKARAG
ncbi:MAG: biotin synthase BioB [gamma proteobacterium symbiont of Ctena orbiculata]|uniref:Biotin synthase n=1 Tax=Candidatus Thiodiazotropha taylori TaxID=2792791 RepID=A0A944M7P2_9GAMM|nr:biotin synthase BioB [Candidatus Thiodiazotropha taylori]PUB84069.1 MAG: biotin synthase BioB [gamma proteobacterium symbiont of Ctena orbiculata]MBT2988956.1 biotin synthase BioB [Candidatus Thiodiazotropha taylori]MBT2996398.1 biotin synthase BioB [Candidatus Thiodiazotropha taylori]MBT3000168.1 biotin synthase BioB [Candidatus Thiodiazotropha taylori]